ncbi:hypothetical protein CAEBREN_09181 [Caenorhabditis brenneri]|uniref:Uncharacterized protein n=1 Tax=Caenorhabditis brenneri TaxID=135651 RepID=G0MRL9_CAEBE|nr:hypothetical protein CAEBREN_09181 [Caenorhabditis brenneri]
MAPNISCDVLFHILFWSILPSAIAYERIVRDKEVDGSVLNSVIYHGVATSFVVLLMIVVKICFLRRRMEEWKYDRVNLIFGYSGVLIINLFSHFYVWWINYDMRMLFVVITCYHALIFTQLTFFIIKPSRKYKYNHTDGEMSFTIVFLFSFPVVLISVFGFSGGCLTHCWFNILFSFFVIDLKVVLSGRYSPTEKLPFYEDEKYREAVEEYEFRKEIFRKIEMSMEKRNETVLLVLNQFLHKPVSAHRLPNPQGTGERQMVPPY